MKANPDPSYRRFYSDVRQVNSSTLGAQMVDPSENPWSPTRAEGRPGRRPPGGRNLLIAARRSRMCSSSCWLIACELLVDGGSPMKIETLDDLFISQIRD